MELQRKQKRGAPAGNQHARKHGYYSPTLDEDEQRDLEKVRQIEGLSHEICLLRVKINSLLRHDPENLKLIMTALSALAKLVGTHYNISADDNKGVSEAINNVLKNVALPMGIELISKRKT